MRNIIFVATLLLCLSVSGKVEDEFDFGEEIVIDVHTHVFNAKYLPLRGIAEAHGVPKGAARVLEKLVLMLTPLSNFKKPEPATQPYDLKSLGEEGMYSAVVDKLSSGKLSVREENQLRQLLGEPIQPSGEKAEVDRSPLGEVVIDIFLKYGILIEEDELEESAKDFSPRKSVAKFLFTLMSSELAIARYAERDFPETDLFIHHMMDMEKAYADRPHCEFSKQVERMDEFDRVKGGRFLNFVAFDPFRRDHDLNYVRNAIEKEGSIGVKFYPPSGYRPAGNRIPNRAGSRSAIKQWESRYGDLTGAELDSYCADLFAYCEREGIPIFIHCTSAGFEAVKGYGLNSSPQFWVGVLDEYEDLLVCFGHAGGYKEWYEPQLDWLERVEDADLSTAVGFEEQAFRLSVQKPNVYLDFGYHTGMSNAADQEQFKRNLKRMIDGIPDEGFYALESKIMFGTDWHMSSMLKDSGVLFAGASKIFSEDADPESDLSAYRAYFFARNAARYLRLEELVSTGDRRLDERQRTRLRKLLESM